jgi:LPS sulfotransferase NodH
MKRPYTGYVREAFTYFTYPFRPKRNPTTKFLIFTYGRSGSNLLVSLLRSHPQIHCNGELLLKRVFFPERYLKCNERLSSRDVYGFKLLSSHFRIQRIADPQGFFDRLRADGYHVISLRRQNVLRQAISHIYAEYRGKFHHFQNSGEQKFVTMHLDLDDLKRELDMADELLKLEDKLLTGVPYLRLSYEDNLAEQRSQQSAVDLVCSYLGIPTWDVSTDLVKTTPQDLTTIIENYAELEAFVAGTKYAPDLYIPAK